MPPWLTDENMHKSHQAILARQEPDAYPDFKADPNDEKVFYWPNVNVAGESRSYSADENPYNRSSCLEPFAEYDEVITGCDCPACEYAENNY